MSQFISMLVFFLTVELLGLAAWPPAYFLFKKLPDLGWNFSKILGILLAIWLVWITSFLGLISFSRSHSILLIIVVACLSWGIAFIKANAGTLITVIRKGFLSDQRNWYMIIGEALFIIAFFVWSDLRSAKPDILDLEKFMDFGFMLSSLKTQYFPPLDHFLAGESINYYYLGHTIGALITQLSGVTPGAGYNLQMSNILALGLAECFSLGAALFIFLRKSGNKIAKNLAPQSYLAGLLSATFVMICGNLHMLIFLPLQGDKYWFPNATRYIPSAIHEYPIYSFVVNDLHGHVSDIPVVLLSIALAFLLYQKISQADSGANKEFLKTEVLGIFIAAAFSIGSSYAISSWDFAIYMLLIGIIFWAAFAKSFGSSSGKYLKSSFFQFDTLLATFIASMALLAIAIAFWLPHWISMKPPTQGIRLVEWRMRSSPHRMFLVWALQFFFVASYFIYAKLERAAEGLQRKNLLNENRSMRFGFLEILILLSMALIILPEIIYFKDIYVGDPRSNTIFKFYYQAWIMLGLISGVAFIVLWNNLSRFRPAWSIYYKIISLIIFISAACYPIKAIQQFMNGDPRFAGLDGTKILERDLPGDAKAIAWLNANIKGQPTILEGVGASYSLYARVSTFTGFPSVLGWPYHEWLWRGGLDTPLKPISKMQIRTGMVDTVNTRSADIEKVYTNGSDEETNKIISKYNIEYIYVGELERKKYPGLSEAKLAKLTSGIIYDKDGVKIYIIKHYSYNNIGI